MQDVGERVGSRVGAQAAAQVERLAAAQAERPEGTRVGAQVERPEGVQVGAPAGGCAGGQVVGEVSGELERLEGAGGWYVVRLPAGTSPAATGWDRRGFVPVTVTVGGTVWDTSLMPMGDGTSFLALPAAVRRAEDLDEGDQVSATYRGRPDPRGTTPTPSTRRGRW